MSTLRIQRIEAKAFKAFKHLDFKLDGRNLLAYGANGSGKSSLYWTLYTFLQSAQKESADVAKYFDKDRPEHLLNLNVTDAERDLAAITVTLQNEDASNCPAFTLSQTQHGTQANPDIRKGCLASDFVTYRILFNFYHFRNSQPIDLWPIFES
jgi:predicted ATP-binding protein involved in virulence